MKPILRSIQTKLVETLKASELKNAMSIVASDAFSVDELIALKVAQTQPFLLFVSLPFPLQTLGLASSCWGTLSLNLTLAQSLRYDEASAFVDWAERISFEVTQKPLVVDNLWNGRFVLTEKEPWTRLDWTNGTALQLHFVTSDFNVSNI